jgi:hypothetical protein
LKKKKVKLSPEAKIIYNKFKKDLKKDSSYLEIQKKLNDVLETFDVSETQLMDIDLEFEKIDGKQNQESTLESLPIESLRDLYDQEYKLRFPDLIKALKLQKQQRSLIDKQHTQIDKIKMLEIELLEKKIELLLKSIK